MALTKSLDGYRFVEIEQGDTLQKIAARTMGDASLWTELIAINDLTPPYLTGDVEEAGPKVKLYGQMLVIPATKAEVFSSPDETLIFGTDILLNKGRLEASESGDLALVSGVKNLGQALRHRVATPLGELLFHKLYGCGVHQMKGRGGTPGATTLAAQYVRSALLADPRAQAVVKPTASLVGDACPVSATVVTVTGANVDLQSTV